MNQEDLGQTFEEFLRQPTESEWLEFKEAKHTFNFEKPGKYFSVIANEANLEGRDYGWLVFGVEDQNRGVVGAQYRARFENLNSLYGEIASGSTEHSRCYE